MPRRSKKRYTTREVVRRLVKLQACPDAIQHFKELSVGQRLGPRRAADALLRRARRELGAMQSEDFVPWNLAAPRTRRVPGYFRWLLTTSLGSWPEYITAGALLKKLRRLDPLQRLMKK